MLWCHGGPGSRIEPAHLAAQATQAGLRIIGTDRPGYGFSTPQPGRTIADWVPDALAVGAHSGELPDAQVISPAGVGSPGSAMTI